MKTSKEMFWMFKETVSGIIGANTTPNGDVDVYVPLDSLVDAQENLRALGYETFLIGSEGNEDYGRCMFYNVIRVRKAAL